MKPCPFSGDREKIVADAMCPVASELRLIEVADLIAMLRFERHADLDDLVTSAAELYFLPGTVKLGIGGDYKLDWRGNARVVLDLEIKPMGVTVYARLTLEHDCAGVEIDHIAFERPSDDPVLNTAFLEETLHAAAYKPIRAAVAARSGAAA
ncbi:hypothetical protein DFR52_10321 [Hoeflea marina]|uniref:Uncharacterized protein n=1 Tax=Hoeflea marina TaxID=274592 RepID=A0A317PJL3_9HYPH|nr:hypothetical protein [Hoeflea marina]PWV99824.1 hypothetical protein DFR52_10321 [Hoeflea marina]